jgi:hypothetical protein
MNAHDRLHAAHLATLDGAYAKALSEYIWFHHHALAEEPALYGVRLSFALAYWKDLADVYPPAFSALVKVRDDKTSRLVAGELDRELFHDVEAINQYLGASRETAQLFESIDHISPEFARECGSLALESLVEAEKFSLAAKYLPAPTAQVLKFAEHLNDDVEQIPERPRSKSPRYRAYTWNFALNLRTIIAILSGAGRDSEATECRAIAFAKLKPWYVRKAVEQALSSKDY